MTQVMKHTIEYNGHKALPCVDFVITCSGNVRKGEAITLCAWCDPDKVLTNQIKAMGYETSHGICEKCAERFLNK